MAILFAALLGYNPIGTLLSPDVMHQLTAAQRATRPDAASSRT